MKVALVIFCINSSLWADLQSRSLENLKEVDVSLGMPSDVDVELWQEAEEVVDPDPIQEVKSASPSKCHQVFFLNESS